MVPAPEPTRDGPAITVVLLPRARGGPLARSLDDARAQRRVRAEVTGDHDPRTHPADALDAALAQTESDWIAFLEGGDRWHPDHLATTVEAVARAGASWGHGAAILLGARGEAIGRREAAAVRGLDERLRERNVVGGASSVVCRRELLAARRPFDRRLTALVLWAAWIVLAGEPSAGCSEPLVAERHEEDRAVLDAREALRDLRMLRADGAIGPDAHAELAARLERLGHGREAARLYARSAFVRRRPGDVVRARRALSARGALSPAVAAPEWLRP
jgi:hypothetical protein